MAHDEGCKTDGQGIERGTERCDSLSGLWGSEGFLNIMISRLGFEKCVILNHGQ
jgi:hypothetical protein